MQKRILFLFLLIPIFSFAQIQIGQDIDGEESFDFFGFSISISANGNILAVGSPFNDGIGGNAGHVRVFENQNGVWAQLGEDIEGEAEGDNFGRSVSLSSNGNVLAAGANRNTANGNRAGHVRVFRFLNGSWSQVGQNIEGEASFDECGESVALSEKGNIVVVGSPGSGGNGTQSGQVRVFENLSGTWTQIGQGIRGESSFDKAGGSISIALDGTIIAIGSEGGSGNATFSGVGRVYENQNGNWMQIGSDISGKAEFDYFAKAITLSSDGKRVAMISGGNEYDGSDAGYVQVFENQNGDWIQIGNDIIGEASGDGDLTSASDNISLSKDGKIIAIGVRHNDGNGESSGHTRIFLEEDGDWIQIGQDIDGEAAGDLSGHSVSISDDGTIVAIGARNNSDSGQDAGHVRIYDISTIVSTTSISQEIEFDAFPNPVMDKLNIIIKNNGRLESVNVYNSLGQLIKAESSHTFYVGDLASGIYILDVATNKGNGIKKFVKL